jgi:hypothetical protein
VIVASIYHSEMWVIILLDLYLKLISFSKSSRNFRAVAKSASIEVDLSNKSTPGPGPGPPLGWGCTAPALAIY